MTYGKNGTLVHKMWPDGTHEFIAWFQYEMAARDYCTAPTDKRDYYLIAVSSDGNMMTFPPDMNA